MIKKRKSSKNTLKSKQPTAVESGFSSLIDSYTLAMEDNSKIIASVLAAINEKGVPENYKYELKNIESKLKKLDKSLDKLGD